MDIIFALKLFSTLKLSATEDYRSLSSRYYNNDSNGDYGDSHDYDGSHDNVLSYR